MSSFLNGFFVARAWLRAVLACASLSLFCRPVLATESEEELDLSTPRRAATAFVSAAHRQDWGQARLVLEGGNAANSIKRQNSIELAQQLAYLLSRSISFDVDHISDAPDGKPDDGGDIEQIAALRVNGVPTPIVLRHVELKPSRWLFSAGTLSRVPEIYAARGPSPIEPYMPPLLRHDLLGLARWQWLALIGAAVLALLVGRVFAYLVTRVAGRLAERTRVAWDDELVRVLRGPLRLFASVVAFVLCVPVLSLPGEARLVCWHLASTLALAALAWSAMRIARVISNVIERRAVDAMARPSVLLATRGVQTQVRVLRRVVTVVIAVITGAIMLMQFEIVRSVGVSLLASAGVAGVVLGFAAQRTLGSLFGGIQLSITQPIRIGDDVIVEGEFGTIEEITLTYVVVKIWDERRLIVPTQRFLEQPFQNWTKVSTELHGTVLLYVDWSLPIAEVRAELDRLLANHPLWDRRTKAVHVTDAKEHTMEVRILVSAKNGGDLFNLRADLRERLVAWLSQLETGRYLPRQRLERADEENPSLQ